MNQDVIFLLAIAPVVGILMFVSMARSHRAHLKSIKDYISYFFWPYQPKRMLIVREVDGTIRMFYDDEFEIIRSKNSYYVRTIYGEGYITVYSPFLKVYSPSEYEKKNNIAPEDLSWEKIEPIIKDNFTYGAFSNIKSNMRLFEFLRRGFGI